MPTNKNAALRYLAIDKCLGKRPEGCQFLDLKNACEEALHKADLTDTNVSDRTLRADIRFMRSEAGYNAPVESFRNNKGWFYRYTDPTFTICKRPLTHAEMDAVQQVLHILKRIDGASILPELATALEGSLYEHNDEEKVISYQSNEYLTGINHLHKLYRHLVNKDVLSLRYRSFKNVETRESVFHPWYLKQYNNRWFLFGYDESMEQLEVVNKAIDRIDSFERLPGRDYKPCTIKWKDYFEDIVGVTRPSEGKIKKIELVISEARAPYIVTKPLHPSQKSRHLEDGRLRVVLELIENRELRQMLYSLGPDLIECKGLDLWNPPA